MKKLMLCSPAIIIALIVVLTGICGPTIARAEQAFLQDIDITTNAFAGATIETNVIARGVCNRIKIDVGSSTYTQAMALTTGDGTYLYGPATNSADVVINGPALPDTDITGTSLGGIGTGNYERVQFHGLFLTTWGSNYATNDVTVSVSYTDQ